MATTLLWVLITLFLSKTKKVALVVTQLRGTYHLTSKRAKNGASMVLTLLSVLRTLRTPCILPPPPRLPSIITAV